MQSVFFSMMCLVEHMSNVYECFGWITSVVQTGSTDLIAFYESNACTLTSSGGRGSATCCPGANDE
jgi:hypothetical protein